MGEQRLEHTECSSSRSGEDECGVKAEE